MNAKFRTEQPPKPFNTGEVGNLTALPVDIASATDEISCIEDGLGFGSSLWPDILNRLRVHADKLVQRPKIAQDPRAISVCQVRMTLDNLSSQQV
ncbi:hypothetical protein WT01_23415 [Burkholderia cepacia]|nr:hypothetical protein WT01_23415 [Burkholderia cepacia]